MGWGKFIGTAGLFGAYVKIKMQEFINGRYLQDVRFSEDMIGDNVEVSIPKNMISDTIVIRMVFPGAVTPKMIGQEDEDERVLSIEVNSISLMAG